MRKSSRVALVLAILGLAVFIPTVAARDSWFFPDARSDIQREWQQLFTTVFWAALVVFVLVEGLLLYALIRFRRRKNGPQEGPHIHGNTKMEIAWTIAPTLVMAWLLVVSLQQLDRVDTIPHGEFTVDVYGHQWFWEFIYPDGTSSTEKLYVEQGRTVVLNVQSVDVIHAFNVPSLGVMIDAVPGKVNHAWFKADLAGEHYTLLSQCRELCGAPHGQMRGEVVVFEPGSQPNPFGTPPEPADNNTTAPPSGNQTGGNGTVPADAVKVTLDSFTITPQTYTAKPGDNLTIAVTNAAAAVHNLYIGKFNTGGSSSEVAWKTKESINQGETEVLNVTLPAEPGAWEWWCNIPGHKDLGMYGVLTTGGTISGGGPAPILPGPSPMLLVLAIGLLVLVLARRKQ